MSKTAKYLHCITNCTNQAISCELRNECRYRRNVISLFFFASDLALCLGSLLAKLANHERKGGYPSSRLPYGLCLPSSSWLPYWLCPILFFVSPNSGLSCAGTPLKPRWRRTLLCNEPTHSKIFACFQPRRGKRETTGPSS